MGMRNHRASLPRRCGDLLLVPRRRFLDLALSAQGLPLLFSGPRRCVRFALTNRFLRLPLGFLLPCHFCRTLLLFLLARNVYLAMLLFGQCSLPGLFLRLLTFGILPLNQFFRLAS